MLAMPSGASVPACVLAGDLCQDDTGFAASTCVNSVYCTPSSACSACGVTGNDAAFSCLANIGATVTAPYTHISCALHVDQNGQPCGEPMTFDASTFTSPTMRTCKSSPVLYDRANHKWSQQAQAGSLQLEIQDSHPDCSFTLVATGSTSTGVGPESALVAADLDNGRGLAIPVTFDAPTISGCPAMSACTLAASGAPDYLLECMQAPPVYPP